MVTERQHWTWLRECLRPLESIKPGMTRQELMKRLTFEGGISSRDRQTFVSRRCPYLKLAVQFRIAGADSAFDRIATISSPFIQGAVLD
jgi:hypothetical protein